MASETAKENCVFSPVQNNNDKKKAKIQFFLHLCKKITENKIQVKALQNISKRSRRRKLQRGTREAGHWLRWEKQMKLKAPRRNRDKYGAIRQYREIYEYYNRRVHRELINNQTHITRQSLQLTHNQPPSPKLSAPSRMRERVRFIFFISSDTTTLYI